MALLKKVQDTLSIQGLSVGKIYKQDLVLPHSAVTLILGESGAGKSALLFGMILQEALRRTSQQLVSPLEKKIRFYQRAEFSALNGLRPAVSLNHTAEALSASDLTVSEFLEIRPVLNSLILREGKLTCERSNCELKAANPETVAAAIQKFPADILCCVVIDPTQTPDFAAGAARLIIDDKYFRVDSAEEFSALLKTGKSAALLINSFRVGPELLERLKESLGLAREAGALSAEVLLYETKAVPAEGQLIGKPLTKLKLLDGFSCELCQREVLKAELAKFNLEYRLNGQTLTQLEESRLADIRQFEAVKQAAGELELGQLRLDRKLSNLSPGERLKISLLFFQLMAPQELIFLLDDLSAHFYPSDLLVVFEGLRNLQQIGNTVVVSDRQIVPGVQPDWIIELSEGRVLSSEEFIDRKFQQTEEFELNKSKKSVKFFTVPKQPKFPLHALVGVTGKAGSGKTHFLAAIDEAVSANPKLKSEFLSLETSQKTSDKMLASIAGVVPLIAELFAKLPAARMVGFEAKMFDIDKRGGRCETCKGLGRQFVEAADSGAGWEVCHKCLGDRFSSRILEVRYRGLNVNDALKLSVRDALKFFSAHSKVAQRLQMLLRCGLGELTLDVGENEMGRSARARLKLWSLLAKKQSYSDLLLLLDHPFEFLGVEDLKLTLQTVKELVGEGLNVVFTTYNPALSRVSDYSIDFSRLDPAENCSQN